MTEKITPQSLWNDIASVRANAPLVHCITNFVVINFNANVLLAAGAAPVMAHAHEEVAAMTGIAQALVLNIGTLDPYWVDSMVLALRAASERGLPTVLDPVGVGATPYRAESVKKLLTIATPTILRGNGSEILSMARDGHRMRGVDSNAGSLEACEAGRQLARTTGSVVCVSGAVDHVIDPQGQWARLSNGHEWMTRITGVGCSATALVGAFAAIQPDPWRATVAAMAFLGVAGEMAAERTIARQQGVGSMQAHLLDMLQLMEPSDFEGRLRMEVDYQ